MTVHEVLRRTLRKGIEALMFHWADGKVAVPTVRLLSAVEEYVGEDVDEHTRPDYIENARQIEKDLANAPTIADRIIAITVWKLNVSAADEYFTTMLIYEAVAEALLKEDE